MRTDIGRRVVTAAMGLAILLGSSLPTLAQSNDTAEEKRLCEAKVKDKLDQIIEDMIKAAEHESREEFSELERQSILGDTWTDVRSTLAQHYVFYD